MNKIVDTILTGIKAKAAKTVLAPVNNIVDENLQDVTTTIGSFIIRSIRGKFQRSITITTGMTYSDIWMEEALYGILYKYNNLKKSSRLELFNKRGSYDGSGMYYRLDDGTHNLKYRDYDILLGIQTITPTAAAIGGGRITAHKVYTIITYNLSEDFVRSFERDMLIHRNSLLKIKKDSPTITVYKDLHEGDGYTYWEKTHIIPKRRLSTIYIPDDQKRRIVNRINEFFAAKKYYNDHGISHNLKILMYGAPGTGKDSITKMIASEWNRNLYYITGGKDGKFIPNALTDEDEDLVDPLLLVSDIDKYPYLITEPDINIDDPSLKEERIKQKQMFGAMINALDGILSGEDKIIIMTTNHIEKFDKDAFMRDGRIDMCEEIGYVTPEVFRKYTHDFYGYDLPADIELVDGALTVAKLQADVIFRKISLEDFLSKHVKGWGKKK